MGNCVSCQANCERAGQHHVRTDCVVYYYQPITNADRIRAMSDEELAEWINKHDCHTNLYGYDPKEAILDWLKQEVSDEKCMDV